MQYVTRCSGGLLDRLCILATDKFACAWIGPHDTTAQVAQSHSRVCSGVRAAANAAARDRSGGIGLAVVHISLHHWGLRAAPRSPAVYGGGADAR